MTLSDYLNLIEQREKAATKGPWDAYFETGIKPMVVTFKQHKNGQRSVVDAVASGCKNLLDPEFIAHARTDIPTLLAMLRLAIKQRDSLHKYIFSEEMLEPQLKPAIEQELANADAALLSLAKKNTDGT